MEFSGFKKYFAIVFCTVTFLCMCFLAWLNVRHFEQTLIAKTQDHLLATARAQSEHLAANINDIRNDLAALKQNQEIRSILQNPSRGDCDLAQVVDPELLGHILEKCRRIELLDQSGRLLCMHPYNALAAGTNKSEYKDVKNTIASGQFCITQELTDLCSARTFVASLPLFSENELIGIVRAELSLQKIHQMLAKIGTEDHTYAWLIDQDGIVISHPNDDLIGRHVIYAKNKFGLRESRQLEHVWDQMIKGDTGRAQYTYVKWQDESNQLVRKITAFHPLKVGNHLWSLSICMEYDQISGPVQAHWREIVLMMFVITLILLELSIHHYRSEKHKSRLQSELKLSKVNHELLVTSDERAAFAVELQKKDELLASLVTAMPGYIYWKNRDGSYLGCNATFAKLAGLDRPSQVRGKPETEMPWDTTQAEFNQKCDTEIIKTSLPLMNMQQTLLSAQGKCISFIANKIPMKNAMGTTIGMLGILYDEKEAARLLPEKANPQKTARYVEQLSHYLRTELANITGYAELLEQEELSDIQKEFLAQIQTHTDAMSERIHQTFIDLETAKNPDPEDAEHKPDPPQTSPEKQTQPPAKDESNMEPDPQEDRTASDPPVHNPAGPAQTDSSAGTNEINILLADDVIENRMLIKTILTKKGYKVQLCENGQEALDLARIADYDVILLDIQMPVMDGLQAAKLIREDSRNRDTAIIALTALVSKGDEIVCLEAGCDDFVNKPIKQELLLNKIHRFVQRRVQLQAAESGQDIYSSLIDDPDYQKTIRMFVENLPARVDELIRCCEDNNLQELSFKVHSLKGIGSFAGFPVYTEKAKKLEVSIQKNEIESIKKQIDELADLCRRTKIIPTDQKN